MPIVLTPPDAARAGYGENVPRIVLVLGGARSGKSAYAEGLALAAARTTAGASGTARYLATAQAFDDEMTERVNLHKSRRGVEWTTFEEPLDLVSALKRIAQPEAPVLVDCLTLWTSNLMFAERDLDAEGDALVACLREIAGTVIFVSNEVGLGIVPDNALARRFRDAAGRLNQKIAATADRVIFVAAGLPMILKG